MHYSAAINLDDRNAIYYANLSAAHNALKEYEDGLKMALAGRKADPMHVKSVYLQAQALYGLGKLRDALSAYEKVFQLQWQIRDSSKVQAQQIQHVEDGQQAQQSQELLLHHLQQQLEQFSQMGASPQQMQQLYQQAQQLFHNQQLNQQLASPHQLQQQARATQQAQQQSVEHLHQHVEQQAQMGVSLQEMQEHVQQTQQLLHAQQVQQAQQAEQQLLYSLQQQLEQQVRMGASPQQMQQLYHQAQQLLKTRELNEQLAASYQQQQQTQVPLAQVFQIHQQQEMLQIQQQAQQLLQIERLQQELATVQAGTMEQEHEQQEQELHTQQSQQSQKNKTGITAEDAVEIFVARTGRQRKDAAILAQRYGVSTTFIRQVWSRQRWWRETQRLWTSQETSDHFRSLLCRTCLAQGVGSVDVACESCVKKIGKVFEGDCMDMEQSHQGDKEKTGITAEDAVELEQSHQCDKEKTEITAEDAVEIFVARTGRCLKDATMLAERYGVHYSVIYRIWNRKRWWRETQHLWTPEETSDHFQSLLCNTCVEQGVQSADVACSRCAKNIGQVFSEGKQEVSRIFSEELGRIVLLNNTYAAVCAFIRELELGRYCRRCAIETAQVVQGSRPDVHLVGRAHFEGNTSDEQVREYYAAHEYLEEHGCLAHDDATVPCISKDVNVVKGFREVVERRSLMGVNFKCARVNGDGILKEIGCAHKVKVEGILETVFKREVYECLVQIEKELTSTRTTLLDKTHLVVDSVDIEEVWRMHGSHFEMSHEEWVQEGTVTCLFRHKKPRLSFFQMDSKKKQAIAKFLNEEVANHHHMKEQGWQNQCRERQKKKSAVER